MKFTSVFVLVACAAATHAVTVAEYLDNIAIVNNKTTTANNLVQAYPIVNATNDDGLAVHNAFSDIVFPFHTIYITAKTLDLPLSLANATAIVDAVVAFRPQLTASFARLITIQPSILGLSWGAGLAGSIHKDLTDLRLVRFNFFDSLSVKLPSSQAERLRQFQANVSVYNNDALAAYP